MNNIFNYAPKELVTDAFLAWCFTEFNDNPLIKSKASNFFYKLGLCHSINDDINDIRVSKQEKNTDLIIRYKVNNITHQALFENKIYSTTHSLQLSRYTQEFPDFIFYKYLKLGYINYSEHLEAKAAGYEIIDAKTLNSALNCICFDNYIADQYINFIQKQFINRHDEIINNLIHKNDYNLFEDSQAQQFLLSELHKSIYEIIPYTYFKYAANSGGSPWTQLDIAKRDNAYGEESEYLFWRIDKRAKGYYLRLNQYSYIDNKFSEEKIKNLYYLRSKITPLLQNYGLILGKISNRGVYESEIAIMFFEDNILIDIYKKLPELSIKISDLYRSISKWEV